MSVAKKYGEIFEERTNILLSDDVLNLREAVKHEQTNPQIWYELGIAYAEQHLFREATEAMSEAISYAAFFTEAFGKRGEYSVRIGRYDEGAADLSMAVHLNVDDVRNWFVFGVALYLSREYHRAWSTFEFVLERMDTDEIRVWMALALLRDNQFERSREIAADGSSDACKILSGQLSIENALCEAQQLKTSERIIICYVIAASFIASGKRDRAMQILNSLTSCIDENWYGYFEHAVRVELQMDAAVCCVF